MANLKNLLTMALLLASFSSYAQDISHGGTLHFSVDWNRVFDTITLKNIRNKRKHRKQICRNFYKGYFEAKAYLDEVKQEGAMTEKRYKRHLKMIKSQETIADNMCEGYFSKRKAQKIKNKTYEELQNEELLNSEKVSFCRDLKQNVEDYEVDQDRGYSLETAKILERSARVNCFIHGEKGDRDLASAEMNISDEVRMNSKDINTNKSDLPQQTVSVLREVSIE